MPLPPVEITDLIVDELAYISHLDHDRNHLKACSLAHSQFVRHCQKWIFRHLYFTYSLWGGTPNEPSLRRRIEKLRKILCDKPFLAHYIKSLYLMMLDTKGAQFAPVLDMLPAIEHVTLLGMPEGLDCDTLDSDCLAWFERLFNPAKLTNLILYNITNFPPNILSKCRLLYRLTLSGSNIKLIVPKSQPAEGLVPPDDAQILAKPKLYSLSLRNCPLGSQLSVTLPAALDLKSMGWLKISNHPEDIEAGQEVVREASKSLKVFNFNRVSPNGLALGMPLDLKPVVSTLSILTFTLFFGNNFVRDRRELLAATETLNTLQPKINTLNEIQFEVRCCADAWRSMAEVLEAVKADWNNLDTQFMAWLNLGSWHIRLIFLDQQNTGPHMLIDIDLVKPYLPLATADKYKSRFHIEKRLVWL